MSGANILYQHFILRGIRLWVEQGELECTGPKKWMTPEFIELLRQQKASLLELLCGSRADPPLLRAAGALDNSAAGARQQCLHRLDRHRRPWSTQPYPPAHGDPVARQPSRIPTHPLCLAG